MKRSWYSSLNNIRNKQLILLLYIQTSFSFLIGQHTPVNSQCPAAVASFPSNSGDLKQARTATAVNKQLNFTVKNKPDTTNYIYCIFEAYFMIKSV